MRLQPDHVQALKRLTAEQFGAGASVRVFGSRLDDDARGGDVNVPMLLEAADAMIAELERRDWL